MKSLPEIGEVIDDTYELVSILGTGGFGAVYRARQINIDRDVALKLLVASGPKFEEMVKRFRREVMAIRNLTHPNTVRIYDFRDDPEGLLYYTMEALDGKTLKEEVRERGPISPRRLKHILHQVLKSLSEAHAQNIVHRDLKPANIMLVDMHGETDFVKVLDFGIAKLLHEDEDIEELTSAGILVGTIRYMAPEQIAGDNLGPHTDLYALGLIAVEMLTGESVFSGTGRWEVLQQQISDEPVRIPQPVLHSPLGAIIERCLQKDPRRRFNGADEVIEALRSVDDSRLVDHALYVRDGEGGWVYRDAVPELSAEHLDEVETAVIDDPIDGAPTEITDITPLGVDDREKTEVTPRPIRAERQEFSQRSTRPVGNGGSPATAPPGGASRRQLPPSPGEAGHTRPSEESDTDLAARQERELMGGQFVSNFESPSSSQKSKKIVAIGAAVAVVLLGGLGAWALMDFGGGETGSEAVQTVNSNEGDDGQDAEEQIADETDEELPEVREIYVEIENPGVRARAYVDDDLRGRTPLRLDIEEGVEKKLRLEAEEFEVFEVVLNWESDEEVRYLLDPVEEEEEEAEQVADRREVDRSAGSTRSSGGSRGGTRSGSGASASRTAGGGSQASSAAADESDDDDDDGWVDISGGADEEETDDSSSASSDWVDLGGRDEPEEKEDDSGERDIPLF